jgi:hypothetical protein
MRNKALTVQSRLADVRNSGQALPAFRAVGLRAQSYMEGGMNAKYISGAMLLALGVAVSTPAVAQIGRVASSIRFSGPLGSQIVAATAIVLVMIGVFTHELSIILMLCPFAAPISQKTTEVRTKSVEIRRPRGNQAGNTHSRGEQHAANKFPRNEQAG